MSSKPLCRSTPLMKLAYGCGWAPASAPCKDGGSTGSPGKAGAEVDAGEGKAVGNDEGAGDGGGACAATGPQSAKKRTRHRFNGSARTRRRYAGPATFPR